MALMAQPVATLRAPGRAPGRAQPARLRKVAESGRFEQTCAAVDQIARGALLSADDVLGARPAHLPSDAEAEATPLAAGLRRPL